MQKFRCRIQSENKKPKVVEADCAIHAAETFAESVYEKHYAKSYTPFEENALDVEVMTPIGNLVYYRVSVVTSPRFVAKRTA